MQKKSIPYSSFATCAGLFFLSFSFIFIAALLLFNPNFLPPPDEFTVVCIVVLFLSAVGVVFFLWKREHRVNMTLLDTNAQLSALLKSIQHGILVVNEKGVIELANNRVESYFGYGENELTGRVVEELIPQAARSQHVAHRATFRRDSDKRMMSERQGLLGLRKDGTTFPLDVGLTPLITKRGHSVVVSVADMSKWTKLQDELRVKVSLLEKVNAEVREANERLNEFVHIASHDLKAPLRAIVNLTTWIREDCNGLLPSASQKHFEQLCGRVRRMERLLDSLLEYSRVGAAEQEGEEFDVAMVLSGIVEMLDVPSTFTLKLPQVPCVINAPQVLFEQVFRNLIDNALKHHDRQEGTIEILVRENMDHIEFLVSDDGPGIPTEYHEKVFQLFQTLRPRDEKEGSGMGLAVVRRIVTFYGGRVYIRQREGRGVTFVVEWKKLSSLKRGIESVL